MDKDEYNLNPNHCKNCNSAILALENDYLKDIKIKIFCSRSCATLFNNKDKIKNISGNSNRLNIDWNKVQEYYNQGYTGQETYIYFGFGKTTWTQAVRRGDIVVRRQKTPLKELLVIDSKVQTVSLKSRLIKAGIFENKCSKCGIDSWCEEPLTIQLHHINGIDTDNRLENLCMLCPNCHTQTYNYGRKNKRKQK